MAKKGKATNNKINMMKSLAEFKHEKLNQLEKFDHHLSNFNIETDAFIKSFRDLMMNSENFYLECSYKKIGDDMFSSRFALFYKDKKMHLMNIKRILAYYSEMIKMGAELNFELFEKINLKELATSKIKEVVVGVDFRSNIKDSRVKFWLITSNDYHQLFNRAIDMFGDIKSISNLINKNELLFGFDFSFDGRTRLKIYPHFYDYELNNRIIRSKLESTFSPAIMEMIFQCHLFYISFEGKEKSRVLHFNTYNIKRFLSIVNNPNLSAMIDTSTYPFKNCIITLREVEILCNDIKTINIYY